MDILAPLPGMWQRTYEHGLQRYREAERRVDDAFIAGVRLI